MVAGLKSKDKFVYIIRGRGENVKRENVKGEMLCNPHFAQHLALLIFIIVYKFITFLENVFIYKKSMHNMPTLLENCVES